MKLIISCTTTNKRLKYLFHTLLSIEAQSLVPDLIFLNVSEDPYLLDEGLTEVPKWLSRINLKIEVNWVPNTGPYRKLLPTINCISENDIVVTIDDDVLYHQHWFRTIIDVCIDNPEVIVTGRARIIKKNFLGRYVNYDGWKMANNRMQSIRLLPIGIDGVAYRKKLINLKFLNDSAFLKVAPKTDDLWFKCATSLEGVEVLIEPAIANGNAYLLHKKGLQQDNFDRKKTNTFFLKYILLFRRHLLKYLGINQSNNDKSWDGIINYVKTKMGKCHL